MRHWVLPILLSLLTLVSLLTLRSVTPQLAAQQALFFGLGFGVFWLITKLKFTQLQNLAWPFYLSVVGLLIVSYVYGLITQRTGRWIPIFGEYNLQPSQLALPATALLLGKLNGSFNQIKKLGLALLIIALPGFLILIEPDLGTSLVFMISAGMIIFLSQVSTQKIITLISLTVIGVILSWFFVLRPYQKQRITSFIEPNQDIQGASYNARQALIAAGSGQLIGRGLGQGVQSHLRFLPERQTDFIFASLAEEFGFVGSLGVVLIYLILIMWIIRAGLNASTQAEYYFCLSMATMIAIQSGINIGMNIGLLPITGLTLPLLSYGGSSLISLMFIFAIIHSIQLHTKPKKSLHIS